MIRYRCIDMGEVCPCVNTIFTPDGRNVSGGNRMSVIDALNRHDALCLEVFPPRTDAGMEKLCGSVLPQLYSLRPDAVSCTYSAGGADAGKNLEVLGRVAKDGR